MAIKDIVGQDRALRILLGTIRLGRVPSAVVMSGDAGVGKALTAVNYAKIMNCLNPVDHDCCDSCMSCRKIDSQAHPDVSIVLPEKDEIRVEAIRGVEAFLSMKPYEGRKKIVILDDADAMNIYAANAFLKTLEEPPPDSLLILVTSNPLALPDTIRSRCTTVRFNPLSSGKCREVIEGKAEGEVSAFVGKLAMGRPGLALSRDLEKEREWFMKLLHAMLRGETKEAWQDRVEMRWWLDLAAVLLRDMVVFRITGRNGDLLLGDGGPERSAIWDRTAEEFVSMASEVCRELDKVKTFLDFNLNKSISWNYVSGLLRGVSVGADAVNGMVSGRSSDA